MKRPHRRPADLTQALTSLRAAAPSAAESQVLELVARRRTELGASEGTVGTAFEALGGTDQVTVAAESARASARPDKALLLQRLARALAPGRVVELGSAFGISGAHFVRGLAEGGGGRFVTIDAAESRSRLAAETLAQHASPDVEVQLVVGLFDAHLDALDDARLVYVDGNHYAAPTHLYVDAAVARGHRDALLVLDDIAGYSPEMDELWAALSKDRRFTGSGRLEDLGVLTLGTIPDALR